MFATELVLGEEQPYIAIIIWLMLILINRGKLTDFFQQLVDRSFYRTLFELKQVTTDFNRDLNHIIDYDELLERILRYLDERFTPAHYDLFIYTGDSFERISTGVEEDSKRQRQFIAIDHGAGAIETMNLPTGFYSLTDIWGEYPRIAFLVKIRTEFCQLAT